MYLMGTVSCAHYRAFTALSTTPEVPSGPASSARQRRRWGSFRQVSVDSGAGHMSRGETVTVFLSAVSEEFHKADPQNPRGFQSYREVLARSLRRMSLRYAVIFEEEFVQGPGDLLGKIDAEIEHSDIVVHLVGNLAGSEPSAAEIRRLRERHPRLLE